MNYFDMALKKLLKDLNDFTDHVDDLTDKLGKQTKTTEQKKFKQQLEILNTYKDDILLESKENYYC